MGHRCEVSQVISTLARASARPARWCAHKRHLLLLLAVLMLSPVLYACQGALVPLQSREAEVSTSDEASTPSLVRIATCWPALPLVEDLVAALGSDAHSSFGAGLSFDIIPADSSTALELLAAGRADLAIIGRQAAPEELALGSGAGAQRSLQATPIAIDIIGIAVPQDSALRNLTVQDLGQVYAGHILNWQELGAGSGQPEIISLAASSDIQQVFEREIMGERPISSAAMIMPHERGVLEYIAQHPQAIGYASAAYDVPSIRWVTIGGASPTAAQAVAGKYPLTHPLFVLTMTEPSREVSRLVSFATSVAGRQIIGKRYILPR